MKLRKVFCLVLVLAFGLLMGNAVWGFQGGDIIWEKTISFTGSSPSYNIVTITSSVVSQAAYIVAGNAKNSDGTNGQIAFIKAFNLDTGDPKWEWILTQGVTNNINGFGFNGDLVLVRGFSQTTSGEAPPAPPFTLYKTIIRAYNANTGALVWEKPEDFFTPQMFVVPNTPLFQSLPNRFFATGLYVDPATGAMQPSTVVVRGYQVRNVILQTSLLLD